MRCFAVACVFWAVLFPAASLAGGGLSGTWSGQMRQIDQGTEAHYPMTLSLQGAKGTTTYPTLECSGTLAKVADAKGGYVIYKEKIIKGAMVDGAEKGCIDGVVVITAVSGKILLGWYGVFEGAASLASASLEPTAQ